VEPLNQPLIDKYEEPVEQKCEIVDHLKILEKGGYKKSFYKKSP